MTALPPWVLFHIPHDSTHIPNDLRDQFALDERDLEKEVLMMTDHHTLDLLGLGVPAAQVIRAPVSRLVLDVERFEDDNLEPMSQQGMGVVYTMSHDGKALRHPLCEVQREKLLDDWYRPHHAALTLATANALQDWGLAVIIDCHSFPSKPLPYEIDRTPIRPQICIGTDAFHTPEGLATIFVDAFAAQGWTVGLNAPFAGAMVPSRHFGRDRRVTALMIEVRRDVYLEEATGASNAMFLDVSQRIRELILNALLLWRAKAEE